MKTAKVKTIDVNVLEWFDRVNGNSYFAGTVSVNYGTKTAQTFNLPFQYGYGDHYKDIALQKLKSEGFFPEYKDDHLRLWELRDKGIVIRTNKQENCKKRELTQF